MTHETQDNDVALEEPIEQSSDEENTEFRTESAETDVSAESVVDAEVTAGEVEDEDAEAVETVEDAINEVIDEQMAEDEELVEDEVAQGSALPLAQEDIKSLLEAAIFAAGEPMPIKRLMALFDEDNAPSKDELTEALDQLTQDYSTRGVELKHVASGYRFQAKADYAGYLQKLWEKKPPRFSRAMLETLALIVYRQPITRGEIEEVRGVSTSSQIMKNLQERDWIKIVAYKDVPGKPAMYGTTKDFLDYFDLQTLKDLPDLKDIIDLEQKEKELNEQLVLNMSLQQKQVESGEQATLTPEQMQDDAVEDDTAVDVDESLTAEQSAEDHDSVDADNVTDTGIDHAHENNAADDEQEQPDVADMDDVDEQDASPQEAPETE